jgi:hypothetical protein
VGLGYPGTYFLMAPDGRCLESTVNQRDLAPWLANTTNNQDYFYDGSERQVTEASPAIRFATTLPASGENSVTPVQSQDSNQDTSSSILLSDQ